MVFGQKFFSFSNIVMSMQRELAFVPVRAWFLQALNALSTSCGRQDFVVWSTYTPFLETQKKNFFLENERPVGSSTCSFCTAIMWAQFDCVHFPAKPTNWSFSLTKRSSLVVALRQTGVPLGLVFILSSFDTKKTLGVELWKFASTSHEAETSQNGLSKRRAVPYHIRVQHAKTLLNPARSRVSVPENALICVCGG